MKTVILGTKNPDKVREFREILLRIPVALAPLPDDLPEAPEDEDTLEGNALAKASFYAARTGCCCLAEDTGLEVDALGGAPGVFTARYAGPDATYASNRRKLLDALGGLPPARRTARFRCAAALVGPGGDLLAAADGVLEGTITDEERGEGGFGYDPIFAPAGEARTLAELPAEEKNRLSHRARALDALRPRLLELV